MTLNLRISQMSPLVGGHPRTVFNIQTTRMKVNASEFLLNHPYEKARVSELQAAEEHRSMLQCLADTLCTYLMSVTDRQTELR